jgi:hypothetical protein
MGTGAFFPQAAGAPGRRWIAGSSTYRTTRPNVASVCAEPAIRARPGSVDLFADDGISEARRVADLTASTWLAGGPYATAFCTPRTALTRVIRHLG